MTKELWKMDYFARTLRKCFTLALDKWGKKLDADEESELDEMCVELSSRFAVIERRLDVLEEKSVVMGPESKKRKTAPKKK